MSKSTVEAEVCEVFRNVYEQPNLVIERSMLPQDLQGFTSLLHIRAMVALDDHFKISLAPEEIIQIKNIGELIDLVKSKTGRQE